MKLAWILKWKIVNVVKFRFYRYPIELNLGSIFFDTEQTPAYRGLCYGEGGNYGRVGPTSKVTTPLAYIDDIINDLIQIFMVNKKSCGNLRMCVKYLTRILSLYLLKVATINSCVVIISNKCFY